MTQFVQARDGVRLAYEVVGSGDPIVLVHGFASDRGQNWRAPGWYATLADAGYRVIAMDCRGHGESDKPYDPARYSHEAMTGDVLSVMSAAEVGQAHLMGYSMGGHIAIHLLMQHPEAITKCVIGGVGTSYFSRGAASRTAIADALLAPDRNTIADPTLNAFREFAEQPGKDVRALAACMRGERRFFSAGELSHSTRPVLVVCGENDALTGPPASLAAAFRDGRAVVVPRRDHMTAVGDKVYKQTVAEFLKH